MVGCGGEQRFAWSPLRSSALTVIVVALLSGAVVSQATARASRRISLSVSPHVDAGATVTASGRVGGATRGARIVLQRRAGRHWLRLAGAPAQRGFSIRFKASHPGRLTLRAALYVGRRRVSTSAARTLIVVPHRIRRPLPPQATWLTLPGSVATYNDLVLLAETTYVHGPNGGGPVYDLVPTRGGPTLTIDDRLGVPSGTTVEGFQSLLTPPLAGHSSGLAVLTMRVTTPANGIQPAHSVAYYSLFDAATGAHILTSAPFAEGVLPDTPVAVIGTSLRLVGCNASVTVTPTGTVSEKPLPGAGGSESDSCTPRAASAVVNSEILIYSESNGCPTVYVTNVVTEGVVSRSPCLRARIVHEPPTFPAPAAFSGSRDWFFDGTAYSVPNEPRFFSAATGAPIEPEGVFALETSEVLGGIRSSTALINSGAGGSSYFVSTSSWLPVFTAGREQSFRAFGIADDDAWVEGAAGRVVISALTGTLLASSWSVFPEAGGAGWTLAGESTGACCSSEYLLRSSETLLAAQNVG
jgi:hypothetical protein